MLWHSVLLVYTLFMTVVYLKIPMNFGIYNEYLIGRGGN
jgi:hypothetical protein